MNNFFFDTYGFDSNRFSEELNKQFNSRFRDMMRDEYEKANKFAKTGRPSRPAEGWGPLHDYEKKMGDFTNPFINPDGTTEKTKYTFGGESFDYSHNGEWKTYTATAPVVVPDGYVKVVGNVIAPMFCKRIVKGTGRINPFKYVHVTGFETINFEMV